MDSFDEFEFRPITEGLGFHKKSPLKADIAFESENEKEKERAGVHEPKALYSKFRNHEDFLEDDALGKIKDQATGNIKGNIKSNAKGNTAWGEPKVRQTLPRPGELASQKPEGLSTALSGAIVSGAAALGAFGGGVAPSAPSNPVKKKGTKAGTGTGAGGAASAGVTGSASANISAIGHLEAKSLFHIRQDTDTKSPPNKPATTYQEPRLVPIAFNYSAVLVDAVVILAFSILFLVAVLVVTKVDLVAVMSNIQTDEMTQLSLGLLFVSVVQIYMITLRSFFGLTLGEWAFDSQLGTAAQQNSIIYPLLVLWRSIFITCTGLIFVPIISSLFRQDLAAYVTGLNLFSRQD